jgi:predicted RNA binding protein YcfA (HicA-like mRNA interferase family)
MKVRELMRRLEQDGWTAVRQRGSHRVFRHPVKPGILVVPVHEGQDVNPGTLAAILKQAGLK